MEKMTAYELADAIRYCGDCGYNLDAYEMLRELSDKIQELELQLSIESYLHKKLATAK